MGLLIDGKWDAAANVVPAENGAFRRAPSAFRHWVTADGSSEFPAAPGRYHLYVAYNCPWAHRTLIFRRLKGLEEVVSIAVALPDDRREGWAFGDFPDCLPDTVNGFTRLHQAYTASEPHYTGLVSVPVLWDRERRTIVNNESADIIRMLNSAFDAWATSPVDYCPPALRAEIDAVNDEVYRGINNGVYRCGFARSQPAYDEAFELLFATLDRMEERLRHRRYLVGDRLTEADWRLFVTLIRFDVVYHPLFRCNRRTIASYPNLGNYLRELYQLPGIAGTVKLRHIINGYYANPRANPSGIIPRGPDGFEAALLAPHDRARLG